MSSAYSRVFDGDSLPPQNSFSDHLFLRAHWYVNNGRLLRVKVSKDRTQILFFMTHLNFGHAIFY